MQNNTNRFVNFVKAHKLLMIGVGLYLVAYILNNIFPPFVDYGREGYMLEWEKEQASGGFLDAYMPRILSENRFIQIFPLDILYFGVADMAAVVHYGIFLPAALITYFSFFLQKILDKYSEPGMGKAEQMLIAHCYNNVLFYPLSFLLIFLQELDGDTLRKVMEVLSGFNQNIVMKIVVSVIFIIGIIVLMVGVIVPMLVNILYFFGYLIVFDVFAAVIEFLDISVIGKHLGNMAFLHELLSFLAAFIIIAVGNLLLEKVLDIAQRISILPVRLVGRKIQKVRQRRNSSRSEENE